ncbi:MULTISPECIES: alpha/beta fold hydrolase [unclassified Pseudovibrio]|uniref:alpha/beta hydrolase family protein n=1 Tax=unclassified Pseudovibrio TaxID=2627060 RepID=UPI0007AE5227|nr:MULTISPECIES: alpha/beta fold hydrolase [unclassified Pseudovibrio]KZL03857.1 Alpha/beta hydrolase family protein [Pseudovibrio sp. W74]KZL09749.1 Alpha/beta hydrolase family protein [Pseudovibrio sp. Ad14]
MYLSNKFIASSVGVMGLINLFMMQTASAAERVVSIPVDNQSVVGTLETAAQENAPIAILLHGFTGTRDELPVKETEEGVFSRMARLLAEGGVSSLRIDFRGSGESDGKWEDTTFSGQIKDAVTTIDWVRAQEQFKGTKIALIGWSQGGLVASHAAAVRPDLDTVVLMAPATNPLVTFTGLFGMELVSKAMTAEPETPITGSLPWGVETTLKARFYQEMPVTSPLAAMAHYDGPLLVMMGLKDALITPQPAIGEAWMAYHDGEEKLIVLDTDHVWSAFEGPQMIDEHVVPDILEWFDAQL